MQNHEILNVVSFIASLTTIAVAFFAFFAFRNEFMKGLFRPIYHVKIIPRMGMSNVSRGGIHLDDLEEFTLDEHACVPAIRNVRHLNSLAEKDNHIELKCLSTTSPDTFKVPFLIKNAGKRDSGPYRLIIQPSDKNVHIIDIKMEAMMKIIFFYSQLDEELKCEKLKEYNSSPPITDYYEKLGLSKDWLVLTSHLTSGGSELVELTLHAPFEKLGRVASFNKRRGEQEDRYREFAIIFRVEGVNELRKNTNMGQWFKIQKST